MKSPSPPRARHTRKKRLTWVLMAWGLLTVCGVGGCGCVSRNLWDARRARPPMPTAAALREDGVLLVDVQLAAQRWRVTADLDESRQGVLWRWVNQPVLQATLAPPQDELPASNLPVLIRPAKDAPTSGGFVVIIWPKADSTDAEFTLAQGSHSDGGPFTTVRVPWPIRWDAKATLALLATAPAALVDLIVAPFVGIATLAGGGEISFDLCDA